MKRKLLCAFLCLLFVLCAFTSEVFAEKLNSETVDWGIYMRAEQVTPTGAVILVGQSGGEHTGNLEYGSAYHLEVRKGNAWEHVPYICEDLTWTMEAHGLPENCVTRWEVDWMHLYGELVPGQYRFVKEFMDYREDGNDEADFYAQFVIESEHTCYSNDGDAICDMCYDAMEHECQFYEGSVQCALCYAFNPSIHLENPDWGISLTANEVTPTGLTVVVSQFGGSHTGDLEYGAAYRLEVWNENGWKDLPYIRVHVVWTAVAYPLFENRQTRWEVDWSSLYGHLPKGRYRYVKEFMDFRDAGDYNKADFYAEFVIADPHDCCDENADEACDICGKSMVVYRVSGSAEWMGNWAADNDVGIMTEVAPGVYRKVFKDVPPGAYELKITKNGKWVDAYGINGQNYTFTVFKQGDITVDFKLSGDEGVISVYGQGTWWDDEDENPKMSELPLSIPIAVLLSGAAALTLLWSKRKKVP